VAEGNPLVSGIMDNLNNTFTNLNSKVGEVTGSARAVAVEL
jgi:hypothetical protein